MKLLTKELLKKLPALYATEYVGFDDKVAVVKFFNPVGRGTWYAVEYDPVEKLFFGYVSLYGDPSCDEWGYFSLEELEGIRLPFGMRIERDLHFKPTSVFECIDKRL